MAAPEASRERWLDGGAPGYVHLPDPVAPEDMVALHPVDPAVPAPHAHADVVDLGDGSGDGGGDG